MSFTWDDLDFWVSGEWDVIQERLDDLKKAKVRVNPKRELMFAALDEVPFDEVNVVIVGQDPYPNPDHATGIAFSVPASTTKFPPTLGNIFQEYCSDLHYPYPKTGDLAPWCSEGVLLLNSVPTCEAFKASSHADWPEYELLLDEILKRLSDRGNVVFSFWGAKAAAHQKIIDDERNRVVVVSHPSPRAIISSKSPFIGSRVFTTINAKLAEMVLQPINWKLP